MGHGCHDCGSPNSCECKPEKSVTKDDVKEWAIRNEVTSEWYCNNIGGSWAAVVPREALATGTFSGCARMPPFDTNHTQFRDAARIVPAPPCEMSDDECWAIRAARKKLEGE